MVRILRSREEIIESILKAAREGSTQTHIMYNAYLNNRQLKESLAFLQEKDCISYDSATRKYTTTSRGLEFIKNSDAITK